MELIKGFLLLLLYISLFVALSWYIIYLLGKRDIKREHEYNRLYKEIQGLIKLSDITPAQEEFIEWKIRELERLPWKNPEKTEVLRNSFLIAVKKHEAVREHEKKLTENQPTWEHTTKTN